MCADADFEDEDEDEGEGEACAPAVKVIAVDRLVVSPPFADDAPVPLVALTLERSYVGVVSRLMVVFFCPSPNSGVGPDACDVVVGVDPFPGSHRNCVPTVTHSVPASQQADPQITTGAVQLTVD